MALSGIEGLLYSAFQRVQETHGLATAMKRFRGLIDDNHWARVEEILGRHAVRRERARVWPAEGWRRGPREAGVISEAVRGFCREATVGRAQPWKRKLVLLELAEHGTIKGKTGKGAKARLFGALFRKAAFGPEDIRTSVEILPQVERTEIDSGKLRVHAKPGVDVNALVERIRRIPGVRLVPVEVLEAGAGDPEIYRAADYPRNPTPLGGPGGGRMPFYYPLYDYNTPSVSGPPEVSQYRQDRPQQPRRAM